MTEHTRRITVQIQRVLNIEKISAPKKSRLPMIYWRWDNKNENEFRFLEVVAQMANDSNHFIRMLSS